MVYVPMLKTRGEEILIAKNIQDYFSESIIPLFELIDDKCFRKVRSMLDPRQDNVSEALNSISLFMKNNPAFIDFFRFSTDHYGDNVDISKAKLSWEVSRNASHYKDFIKMVSSYSNLYPVISLKDDFIMSKSELREFLTGIQSSNSVVALRLTDNLIDGYKDILSNDLRGDDFLILDIGEQSPGSKFIEIEELIETNLKAKFILANSPRKANIKNGIYPQHGKTNLIDCSARFKVEEYNLYGFADYCGLKDVLPVKQAGSNGTGSALALFYSYSSNDFMSYMNPNTKKGMRGYLDLYPLILADKNHMDPDDDCPAFYRIEEKARSGASGNWCTWINFIATRYVHQIYKNI